MEYLYPYQVCFLKVPSLKDPMAIQKAVVLSMPEGVWKNFTCAACNKAMRCDCPATPEEQEERAAQWREEYVARYDSHGGKPFHECAPYPYLRGLAERMGASA